MRWVASSLLLLFFTACDGDMEETDIFNGGTINNGTTTSSNSISTNSEEIVVEEIETIQTLPATGQTNSYFGEDDGERKDGIERNFVDGGGYIHDKSRNLMWQDSEPELLLWEDAKRECSNLVIGDYSDWRVPTRKELVYLTDKGKQNPAIDDVFRNIRIDGSYWSSTESDSTSGSIWSVEFFRGEDGFLGKNELGYNICVREASE